MSVTVLVWTVPVVAAVAALVVLLAHVRKVEDLCVDLAREVGRVGDLRRPLAELRREMDRSEALAGTVWRHWDPGEGPRSGEGPAGG